MTPEEMGKGIRYLKAYYPKWDFDINDGFMLEVWYEALQDISYEGFKSIIKDYCKSNQFPPLSPTDIKNMIPKLYSVGEAWELIYDVYQRNTTQEFFLKDVLKTYPTLYEFIKGYDFYKYPKKENEILEANGFSFYGYSYVGYEIGRAFRRNYKEFLDSIKVKYVGNRITCNQLLLGA